jgi:hypothetical protein
MTASEDCVSFAAGLRDSLETRRKQLSAELTSGECLRHVLGKHLLAVEAMSDPELTTSILLLSHDGKRLSHAAAPRLPQSYCEAIDESEIGPCAGSCGTAAYLGRPVYVSDIAADPLWADYRHIALPHGLRSCWSTPIRDPDATVIGTFAVYRSTIGYPTKKEIEAIDLIAEHVAQAIMLARTVQDIQPAPPPPRRESPRLSLVATNEATRSPTDRSIRLLELADTLELKIPKLRQLSAGAGVKMPPRRLERRVSSAASSLRRSRHNASANRTQDHRSDRQISASLIGFPRASRPSFAAGCRPPIERRNITLNERR